ncbi:MAG TPA: hypothetical protein DD649_19705 [Providencia sp.]|uniref:hypothetical protein n=1 Tax=Providencia sp. TaxID=589 RepID=UPI000E955843|nr:hypothetical protein [Providencia sp.]HBO25088.1 hypothetical protein [Providencia sp.]
MCSETNKKTGNIIELKINNATVCYLRTDGSVAADYLSFIAKTIEVLMLDRNSLELEANAFGKTIQHGYSAFSTIKDPKGL